MYSDCELNTQLEEKMSRTYRRKKGKYLIKENRILLDSYWDKEQWRLGYYVYYYEKINPKSKEGKRRIAKFHSDNPQCIINWFGPSWFRNMYGQRPYRRECKREIKKYIRDNEYDISLLRKPHVPYYY